MQITGKCICTNVDEIEQIFSIQMMMGIIKMPNYHDYWQSETCVPMIADTMSHRYKNLCHFMHIVDNNGRNENVIDKLFKICPVLQKVRDNCRKIQQEPVTSIDEQIIPAKTTRSGIRQYNPKSLAIGDSKCSSVLEVVV